MYWFCVTCDDQAPWSNEDRVLCPTCREEGGVIPATRFMSFGAQLNDSLAAARAGCGDGSCGACECGRT